jgi:hypothetical protein
MGRETATVAQTEPERELIRRVAPLGLGAIPIALLIGAGVAGWNAGISAGIGVAVVLANFAANGWSLAWAAGVSLTVVYAVGLGGFVVRLGVILGLMSVLNRFAFFSPVAFAVAVVPCTILLLGYEMRLLTGGLWSQLWIAPQRKAAAE